MHFLSFKVDTNFCYAFQNINLTYYFCDEKGDILEVSTYSYYFIS